MKPELQREIMEAYFGKDGLAYSIARLHINRFAAFPHAIYCAQQSIALLTEC